MSVAFAAADIALSALTSKPLTLVLHTGDPGRAGLSNRAEEKRRFTVDFSPPQDGVARSKNRPEILRVAASETWTAFSLWARDTFLYGGPLPDRLRVTRGDDVELEEVAWFMS